MLRAWLANLIRACSTDSRHERRRVRAGRGRRAHPGLESLEDRTLLAVFPVTSLADSGPGSLRQAILDANTAPGNDTITFDVTGTINLTGALPALGTSISIEGPGRDLLTVRRFSGSYRIFTVPAGATVQISGLTIANGQALGFEFDSFGGGIFNGGTLTISNSTLSGNEASSLFGVGHGGGIYNVGTLTVSDSIVSENLAQLGAGIMNDKQGVATITGSTLSENGSLASGDIDGPGGPGGGIANRGTLSVHGSTISANGPSVTGGGIDNFLATATVINSTVSANRAQRGGGISNNGGTVTIRNSTVVENIARVIFGSTQGGGIHNQGNFHARNTIIAGNQVVPTGQGPDYWGSLTSSDYNLIGNASGGSGYAPTDLLNVNPLLGPLQDNGGPTFTHALLPGSPALDAGDNTDAPDFDQRGLNRVVGGTIDIGAFEVQPGAATHFALSVPAGILSGVPFDVTVTALDAYGHVAVGYTGTVTFTTTDTDPGVRLPAAYTFTADDQGVHTFAGEFVLVTTGELTLTVTDLADGITGSITLLVVS